MLSGHLALVAVMCTLLKGKTLKYSSLKSMPTFLRSNVTRSGERTRLQIYQYDANIYNVDICAQKLVSNRDIDKDTHAVR